MKKIAFLLLSFVSLNLSAQDSASVLFIGNSYTYVNDLPTLLQNLANSLGDQVYKDSQTPGGTTFAMHAANNATYTKINAQPWDYVILQGQSQEPSFPDSQVDTETIPYAIQLADSVYANKFCSEVMMFMTWGRENGDPQWAPISTFDGMNARLRSAYLRMADSVQGSVSPVGSAWKYIRDNHPTIQLYSGDGSHPSLEGSYLAACTFYASIFRKSPVGASFISTLDQTTAGILQNAAYLTVMDSLDFFNLRPISEHTQAHFSSTVNLDEVTFDNQSTKAQTYFWDFGDGGTSTDEYPVHTYLSNGTYVVTLIAESPCDSDTTTATIVINQASLNDLSNESISILKTEWGVYHIMVKDVIDEARLFDLSGRECLALKISGGELDVNLQQLNLGSYFLQLSFNGQMKALRLENY